MVNPNAFNTYQIHLVQSQPQEKLVLLLYEGAQRFILRAIEETASQRPDKVNEYLGRAQDILLELSVTLNYEAGEIARNLRSLYDFMRGHLARANARKDPAMMKEVCSMLGELREAWEGACLQYRSRNYGARQGMSLHG